MQMKETMRSCFSLTLVVSFPLYILGTGRELVVSMMPNVWILNGQFIDENQRKRANTFASIQRSDANSLV